MWGLLFMALMGFSVAGIGGVLLLVPFHESLNERFISEEIRLDAARRDRMERLLHIIGLVLLMFGLVVGGVMVHAALTETW